MTVVLRRILATAGVGLALFGAAACADQPQNEPKASASPTKGASTLADKKTTCDAFLALSTDTTNKATPLLAKLQNGEQDPAGALGAFAELKTVFADYATKLSAIVNNAGDAQVKSALSAELAAVRQAQADVDAAAGDQAKIQAAVTTYYNGPTVANAKAACS